MSHKIPSSSATVLEHHWSVLFANKKLLVGSTSNTSIETQCFMLGTHYSRSPWTVFTGRERHPCSHGPRCPFGHPWIRPVNTGVMFEHPWTRSIEIGRRFCQWRHNYFLLAGRVAKMTPVFTSRKRHPCSHGPCSRTMTRVVCIPAFKLISQNLPAARKSCRYAVRQYAVLARSLYRHQKALSLIPAHVSNYTRAQQ